MRWRVQMEKQIDFENNKTAFLEEVSKEHEIECLGAKGKMKMVMCKSVLILEGNRTLINVTTEEDKRILEELKKEWDEDMKAWQRYYMLLQCENKEEAAKVFGMEMYGWGWWREFGANEEWEKKWKDKVKQSLMQWTGLDGDTVENKMGI